MYETLKQKDYFLTRESQKSNFEKKIKTNTIQNSAC